MNKVDFPIKRRVALVTGATGGVGVGICHELNNHGYYILVAYKSRKKEAHELASGLRHASVLMLDVAKERSIEAAIEEIKSHIGRLDVIVNNAAVLSGLTAPLHELTRSQWRTMLEVNVIGPAQLTSAALSLLCESPAGRVINISSAHGISGGRPGLASYATAKAALIGFTKAASKELAPNITVNAVAPGFVEVGMSETMSPELRNSAKKFIPMKRFARASEVGAAVAFLASESAAYITGQTLVVSGGRIDLDPGTT